jgi:DNA-binding LacI/PurR family transcriptional regulator
MGLTLRELAAATGWDVSTVSRALRDDPRVQPSTRQRVQELAHRLGYQPNLAARNLVTGQTRALWLIVASIAHPIDYEPAQAASRFCHAQGYDLHIVLHHSDPKTLERVLQRLQQQVADGALIVSSGLPGERKLIAKLVTSGFPLVFLDRHVPGVRAHTWTTDNAEAAAALVRHCQQAGASAVLNLFGNQNEVERARCSGAIRAADEVGLHSFSVGRPQRGAEKGGGSGRENPAALALVASTAGEILAVLRLKPELAAVRRLVFGCFDAWPGEPYPAEKVFVCEQDFVTMAERASELLLRLTRHEPSGRTRIWTVPAKGVRTVARAI